MNRVALTFDDSYPIDPYVRALEDAGLEPLLVTPTRPIESLQGVAGLVLSGGVDLDPACYGQAPHPKTNPPMVERDALEQRLLEEALAADLPVLAICRGMQLFNVMHAGGTLAQHIEGHRIKTEDKSIAAHDVVTVPGTRLARILGEGIHPVNSRHHQAVDHVGAGLIVSARSQRDGVIEGLERPDLRFAVAVQWHPENQIERYAEQRNLFRAFRDALRQHV